MRNYIKTAVFAVSVALLLSGCGGYNTPSGTEREKDITTTSDTEEVTTAATEVSTTTSAATTVITTVETTAASAEEEMFFKDRYLLMPKKELSEQVDILEKHFYGRWYEDEHSDRSNRSEKLVFSDSEDIFEFGIQDNIEASETETGYALYCRAGGVWLCFYIDRSEPDKLYYSCKEGLFFGEEITINENGQVFAYSPAGNADIKNEMKEHGFTYSRGELGTQSGNEISVLGQMKLNSIYGADFDKMTDMLEPITDDTGDTEKEWVYVSGGYGLPEEKRYLVNNSDEYVRIAFRYLASPVDPMADNSDERYYASTFMRGSNGEWSLTGFEPYEVPEKEKE